VLVYHHPGGAPVERRQRIYLEHAHGVIGAGEDHLLHARAPRRLKDVVGALDVVVQHVRPRCIHIGRGGEVYHRVDTGECGQDRVQVGDIRCQRFQPGDRIACQRPQLIFFGEVAA